MYTEPNIYPYASSHSETPRELFVATRLPSSSQGLVWVHCINNYSEMIEGITWSPVSNKGLALLHIGEQ